MRAKIVFVSGFATGYVLGSRAGRARYEQIAAAARAFARNPKVASTTGHLQHQASEALATAKDKAVGAIGDRLQERRPSWLPGGGGARTYEGEATVAADGWPAGSNGHVGP
ncbi:MAG: hypothetical protein QOE01_110 [Actinomycetota bacterium]|jgi:hypothetical protein|nr:hypothetical protein [Actinomycetota bacterium]